MSAPPRKKLKQATIFEGFERQKSITTQSSGKEEKEEDKVKTDAGLPVDLTEDSPPTDMAERKPATEAADDDNKKAMREKAAEAAERRKLKESPGNLRNGGEAGASGSSYNELPATSKVMGASDGSTTEPDSQGSNYEENSEPFLQSERDHSDAEPPCSMGTPLHEMKTTPACSLVLPDLRPSHMHTVLIHCAEGKVKLGTMPQPYPNKFKDKWDKDYVRMPCSRENLFPCGDHVENRWKLIEKALRAPIRNSWDLEAAIMKYNKQTGRGNGWDFYSLHQFFLEEVEDEEKEHFFNKVLPEMVELALNLERICTAPIPLLRRGNQHKLTLSQKQVACLLANAFFCTFPRRNSQKRNAEYSSYPSINFNSVFANAYDRQSQKMEKIKCIIHYFQRVTKQMPMGVVTFKRQLISDPPKWESSEASFTRLHVSSTGNIEDDGAGMLQVDFANKYVGGGVLGRGCVQEEIRFLVNPELIVSRLFCEVLDDRECLLMTGTERFSAYKGYAASFKWDGNYIDPTRSDAWCRRYTEIVAIDAKSHNDDEFGWYSVERELNKAYCGFSYIPEADRLVDSETKRQHTPAVATGNWGCGAFGGDVKLKALIQFMAGAEAGRDVCYFTFNNTQLVRELHAMHEYVVEHKMTVGELSKLIQKYSHRYRRSYNKPDLYHFIRCEKEGKAVADIDDFDQDSREGWVENSQELYAGTP